MTPRKHLVEFDIWTARTTLRAFCRIWRRRCHSGFVFGAARSRAALLDVQRLRNFATAAKAQCVRGFAQASFFAPPSVQGRSRRDIYATLAALWRSLVVAGSQRELFLT